MAPRSRRPEPIVRPVSPVADTGRSSPPALKFYPPRPSPTQVVREGIGAALRRAQTARLVLIRAPAGYGKTTAMVQYRQALIERGVQTTWLTLDAADNDEPRFVRCLERSVADLDGDPERGTIGSSGAGTALSLMDRLTERDQPFAVFLDDFETIQSAPVLSIVREMLDRLPAASQLVVASRSLPDLQLGRLRARGLLVEIDTEHLRFSRDEIDRFFDHRQDLRLSAADLSLLHRKSEGWISVIWLASIALRRSDAHSALIARFSGSDKAIAEYLAEDVFNAQPAAIRDFMTRTSVLGSMNASLCDALMDRNDSEAVLATLATGNLFLTPIADDDRTYRYHSLFADFLMARLARDTPLQVTALHRGAARWYEANERPVPAIDHAIEGAATGHATDLLLRHAEAFLAQGRMRLLTRWFDALPADALVDHPLLDVFRAWALLFTRGPDEAKRHVDRIDAAGVGDRDADVRAYLQAIKPILHTMMDRYEEAYSAGRAALATLPSTRPFADSALTNAMAIVLAVMDKRAEAHALLEVSRGTEAIARSPFNRMYSETVEGIIDLQEGRMRQAAARFAIAVHATHATDAASNSRVHGNAWAGVLFAGTIYERGDAREAEHLLHIYLPLAADAGLPDHVITGHAMLSRIAFQRGDVDLSLQLLGELERFGHARRLPRVVASAKLERAYLLLCQANGRASREMLDRAADRLVWERVRHLRLVAHDIDNWDIADLRWQVRFGPADAALPALRRGIAAATVQSRHRRALKLRILEACALRRVGDVGGALDGMTAVLKTACDEGCRRFVLDEGDAVGALVLEVAKARALASSASEPILDEYVQRLAQAIGPSPLETAAAAAGATPAAGRLVEPLTAKETRILALLADGYSNQAISEKLFVSDSTVRTHLRNINAKLQVRSRAQAVALARRIGILT